MNRPGTVLRSSAPSRGCRTRRRAPVLTIVALLAACTATRRPDGADPAAEIPPFAGASVDDGAPLPPIGGLLALDDGMREFVRAQLLPVTNPVERARRLSAALLEPGGLGIRYDGSLTQTARDVFRTRAGNCLSFTALVVTLAREAGLQASFQDVPVLPRWQVSGNAFLVERHVNALLRAGTRQFVIDFRPPDAATYSATRVIADANAIAQYFGNLGVERFAAGDLAGAYRLIRRGLEADPQAVTAWVNLGVVLARNRQWREAERAYRTALELEPGNLSALNNLALLLAEHGDPVAARRLQARVEDHRRRNPYYLYWLGERHLQSGRPDAALGSFATASRRMPGEPDFHFAMARAYLALGDAEAADRSFKAALDRAASPGIRERYARQYQALTAAP